MLHILSKTHKTSSIWYFNVTSAKQLLIKTRSYTSYTKNQFESFEDYQKSIPSYQIMSSNGGKILTIALAVGVSWYTGVKFWQPLIVDQLRKDGNLRDDIYIADTSYQPKSWQDLKDKVKDSIHPEQANPVDNPVISQPPASKDDN